MGCDGGTIPKRDELVRTKKKPEKKDRDADRQAKWKNCSLSQEALQQPIMACELGRLYNKMSALESLLEKSGPSHLRGLKDLRELQLTENPTFGCEVTEKGGGYKDTQRSQYICPVTAQEMNGKYKFCFIWGCGCVISEKALKEIPSEICHKCGKKFSEEEVIMLNGTDEEVDALRQRMTARREAAKLEKKAKKLKRKVEGEEEVAAPKTKPSQPTATTASDKSSRDKELNGKESKKAKSIQEDPKASATYKSLFTTCTAAKRQPQAHWVTYNPCYN